MSYIPTQWRAGDIITEDKLNNIEKGILDINANLSKGPYGVPSSIYNLVVPIEVDQYHRILMTHPLPVRAAITKIAEEHKSSIDAAEEQIHNALDNGASITEANANITEMLVEAGYSWKPDGTNGKLLLYGLNNGIVVLADDEETDEILSEELLSELTDVYVMKFFTNDDIYNLETIKIGNSPFDYKIYYPIPNGTVGSTGGHVYNMVLAPAESYSRGPSYIVFAEITIGIDNAPPIPVFMEYSDEVNAQ